LGFRRTGEAVNYVPPISLVLAATQTSYPAGFGGLTGYGADFLPNPDFWRHETQISGIEDSRGCRGRSIREL